MKTNVWARQQNQQAFMLRLKGAGEQEGEGEALINVFLDAASSGFNHLPVTSASHFSNRFYRDGEMMEHVGRLNRQTLLKTRQTHLYLSPQTPNTSFAPDAFASIPLRRVRVFYSSLQQE